MTKINPGSDASDIVVVVDRFPSISKVELLWRDLESRAAASFFLSWTWIGTWLAVTRLEPAIVTARVGDRLVGLGLLNRIRRGRLGMKWPTLSLNEVGRAEQDCIMIEDNGLLAERGAEAGVTAACLDYLTASVSEWRELRLSGVPAAVVERAGSLEIALRIEAKRPSYIVDVGVATVDGELASLSGNARQQINRSLRLYRKRGELTLQPSTTTDEAMARFAEMEALHQRHWVAKGKPGAFANPFFRRFHRTLLTRGFAAREVDVLRVAAGSKTIGLLYTFFHRGDAYAYQSGFAFEADARLKPGLVSHRLAIAYCHEIGLRRYRLLAGDSRYKRTLATESYELYWLSLRRPDFAFRLERIARRIVGRVP